MCAQLLLSPCVTHIPLVIYLGVRGFKDRTDLDLEIHRRSLVTDLSVDLF